jgi:flagellar motor protein MotB
MGIINRRRALQAIGAMAVASELVNSAQAAGEPYHIFFNYGASEPPISAKPIVDALRASIKKNSRVTVTGHCDTSEPNASALGMARAVAVLKVLTEPDLPADVQLTALSKAATDLKVKTAANVKEPQNRRVAILIA